MEITEWMIFWIVRQYSEIYWQCSQITSLTKNVDSWFGGLFKIKTLGSFPISKLTRPWDNADVPMPQFIPFSDIVTNFIFNSLFTSTKLSKFIVNEKAIFKYLFETFKPHFLTF